MPTPTIKLSSGYDMPMLGLGTWQSAPGQVAKAVEMAVKAGYRLIDCAYLYENQVEIGEALKKLFATGVKREDLFITSKVWNTFHSAAGCKKNVDEILKELQLNYVDLMLIHWPHGYQEGDGLFPKKEGSDKTAYSDEDYLTTWKSLEECVKEGKIRSIGLANFNHKQIERLLANCTIKPALLQVECHPYFQQKKLRAFCNERGIVVNAYSSLANPGSAYFRKEDDPNVLTDPVMKKIAEAHKKNLLALALLKINQKVMQNKNFLEIIRENADLFDFQLIDGEMKAIDGMDRGWRILHLDSDADHPLYPFSEEY
ncbi:oxidoreductase, aldo/keto reductase family protein [Ancylostoma ceylanicum]|uniref:Oxidoreductase, aldo/keto reductase family protein n=1 Tax=Ancylostoma ceylanicum TaxID=53326 RepID=A0A0D6M867_9BILA|nr:oxidoreductase, aldo/keto reductase family protein [Ancylostoma ceylanicum]